MKVILRVESPVLRAAWHFNRGEQRESLMFLDKAIQVVMIAKNYETRQKAAISDRRSKNKFDRVDENFEDLTNSLLCNLYREKTKIFIETGDQQSTDLCVQKVSIFSHAKLFSGIDRTYVRDSFSELCMDYVLAEL